MAVENGTLSWRDFRPADLPEVLNLHELAMRQIGAWAGHGPWHDDLADIPAHYQQRAGAFLVGEENGRIIAMGAFRPGGDGYAEVKRMRVHPDRQGRGYGRAVLGRLEALARTAGYRGFVLETSEGQAAARGLYAAAGFRETGRGELHGFAVIWYRKDFY